VGALSLIVAGCDSKPKAEPSASAEPAAAPAVDAKADADAEREGGLAAMVDEARSAEASPGEAAEAEGGVGEVAADAIAAAGIVPGSGMGALPLGPLATVGTVDIPMSAFREIYDLKVAKYAERGRKIPSTADRRYRKSIAERLIYHELLAQEAKRLGVDYDPAALAEREAQQRLGIRDWAKHLARRGETEASLRAMVVAELREKAILEKLGELTVSASEIDTDYEKIKENWRSDETRVRASHILVPIGPTPPPMGAPKPSAADEAKWTAEAEKTAREIHTEVTRPGADFAAVARARSTGPSATKGGDIGIFTRDRMAKEFSDVAFKLEVGRIAKPVKTKFGFHIIKLTGKWPPGVLPKSALEDQIRDRLGQRKLHAARRGLKERLMRDGKVVDNMTPTLGPEPKRRRARAEPDEGKAEPGG
jgi:hypothetical protein